MKLTKHWFWVGLLVGSMILNEAAACLNTSYSREEDKQLTGDLTKILSGQVAEHGEDFYRNQKEELEEKLRENPYDVEMQNDLGAAELKLKDYDSAMKRFKLIEDIEPGLYKTHANLGVLYKKMGNFELAAEHTRKALSIRPEGHLGLGDYYLRMLTWRANRKARATETQGRNFLGDRYADGASAVARNPATNKEHLVTLIKADRHFEDTYIVLGDLLFIEGDLQNAIRAYSKAQAMLTTDDNRSRFVNQRIGMIKSMGSKDSSRMDLQLRRERNAAEGWVASFQEVESELIASGKQVAIQTVKEEMERRDILEPSYFEAEILEAPVSKWIKAGYGLLAASALLGLIWAIQRARRHSAGDASKL